MRPDIVSGALFPDYELSDHHGMRRTISALQGGDPLVLVLSRGGFLSKGEETARRPPSTPPRDAGRLLPPRDNLDRQPARDK